MNALAIITLLLTVLASAVFAAEPTTGPSERPLNAEAPRDLLAPDASLKKLSGGFKFLEGPVWIDRDGGYLIFCDTPGDRLYKWTAKDGVTVYREHAGRPNGDTVDLQGRLITCENEKHRVTRTELDGTVTVLADSLDGKRFNSTNDAVVKSDGTIWFTDPTYGIGKGDKREIHTQNVFAINPAMPELQPTVIVTDFDQPNGLCFSADEKFLYIADSGKPHNVRRFSVTAAVQGGKTPVPWTLSGGEVFCPIAKGVPDGMRCDTAGRLWTTAGDGVHVFTPDGKEVGMIAVPETPANCAFGGKDGTTLFITARTGLYSVETKVEDATTVVRAKKF